MHSRAVQVSHGHWRVAALLGADELESGGQQPVGKLGQDFKQADDGKAIEEGHRATDYVNLPVP